jgi:hypothetical protein
MIKFYCNSGIDMAMDFKTKKKEIYIPVKKIVKNVIKDLRETDIHISIGKIARMDIAGMFQEDSLTDFRKTIYDYLKLVNQYRSLYFEFMKKTKTVFDQEMTIDGSFAPGLKQYDSLKNQLYEALLKTDGKAWILSYDQYLPTIREHASKRSKHPRLGKKMLNEIKSIFEKDLKNIKELQKLSIQLSKLFLKDLDYAIKNPDLDWQQWLTDEKYSKLKSKSKKYQ